MPSRDKMLKDINRGIKPSPSHLRKSINSGGGTGRGRYARGQASTPSRPLPVNPGGMGGGGADPYAWPSTDCCAKGWAWCCPKPMMETRGQNTPYNPGVSPVRPIRPGAINANAVSPVAGYTMGQSADAIILSAVRSCSALGSANSARDFQNRLNRCANTPQIQALHNLIRNWDSQGMRGSFWRFMARACCVASLGQGDGCCDNWDTE